MRVCVLGSGSSGNSIYLESGSTGLLVDAGLSAREIERRLLEIEADPRSLSGIALSHEHGDHVRSVGVVARRYGIPIWGNESTLEQIRPLLTGKERLREFSNGRGFGVGDLLIQPFSVPHDAADPSQFLVSNGETVAGIATDLGFVSQLVRQRLEGADFVVLESNHDEQMLVTGPYPWAVKQRIKGRKGHLSNRAAAEALGSLARKGLSRAVLAHLSQENNTPAIALQTSEAELAKAGVEGFQIGLAHQHSVGDVIVL